MLNKVKTFLKRALLLSCSTLNQQELTQRLQRHIYIPALQQTNRRFLLCQSKNHTDFMAIQMCSQGLAVSCVWMQDATSCSAVSFLGYYAFTFKVKCPESLVSVVTTWKWELFFLERNEVTASGRSKHDTLWLIIVFIVFNRKSSSRRRYKNWELA